MSGQSMCFFIIFYFILYIANRLKKVFPSLINEDQTGSNRYMGDNSRLIYDLIHYSNCNNLPGLLICIDFEKAFDSVDWNFMEGLWIWSNNMSVDLYILRQNYRSLLMGILHPGFFFQRGCRQGDLVSPYVSVTCGNSWYYDPRK